MLSESEHEAQRAEAAQTLVSMDTSATPVKGEASGVDEAGGAAAAEGGVLLEGPAAPAPGALEEGAQASLAAAAAAEAEAEAAPPVQKSRTRCFKCNKKVGLTGIECRCKLVFCGLHRYPESHDCGFDFKASDRLALEKVVLGGGAFSKVDRL
ncbi:hypothetical protein JKP88DRAFT_232870 [Tribonema minus]|uniref:AN1-type domain-containing protein n=1 Tax=Tribonema minus TaxID=303371 RepID=A0A836CLQ8_9STRA|nr:hypothetical protein JKP88DRAFT_232870 [Tribonema minus]